MMLIMMIQWVSEQFQCSRYIVIKKLRNRPNMTFRATSLPQPGRMLSPPSEQHMNNNAICGQASNLEIALVHQNLFLSCVPAAEEAMRSNKKILIRRNKQKFHKGNPVVEINMRKTMNYLADRQQGHQNNQSFNLGLLSQKQKFMGILQSKILKNQNGQLLKQIGKAEGDDTLQKKINSNRYKHFQSKGYQLNLTAETPKEAREDNRGSLQLSAQPKPKIISHRAEKQQNQLPSFRYRSRTINKDQAESRIPPHGSEMSRTIELQPFEQKLKMHKSLIQIQIQENHSFGRDTKQFAFQVLQVRQERQQFSPKRESLPNPVALKSSSNHVRNTEAYEKQINNLTKDYFQEWDKMNSNKSKIYHNLRKKIITVFPNMKKYYNQFKQSSQSVGKANVEQTINKKESVEDMMLYTDDLQSNRRPDKIFPSSSIPSISILANLNETNNFQEKLDLFHQKQLLNHIFKQAYFWSRTKNKFMSTNPCDLQRQKKQMVNLRKIQKNLTFMHYMKSKRNKSKILSNKDRIKGSNIIKNQDSILEMEKDGTKEQQFLKKCLDNAIERCIKDNQ